MKITELRIGNWVNYFGQKHTVRAIGNGNVTIGIERYKSENVSINSISPINLTEEWLLKFGFVKEDSEWKLFPCFEIQIIVFNEEKYNGVMFYTRTIHTDYVPIYCGSHINYVHQLQNFFYSLCGKELAQLDKLINK